MNVLLALALFAGASELQKFGRQYGVEPRKEKKDECGFFCSLVDGLVTGDGEQPQAAAARAPVPDSGPPPFFAPLAAELGVHSLSREAAGGLFRGRLLLDRLGFGLSYTAYSEGEAEETHLSVFHIPILAAHRPARNLVLFAGAGLTSLAGADSRAGPLAATGFQWGLWGPLIAEAEGSYSYLHGSPLWDLRAGLGVGPGPLKLTFGWRELRGPAAKLDGPEITLGLKF